MADIRTLKLALLADTKNFIDGLDKADKETKTFSNKYSFLDSLSRVVKRFGGCIVICQDFNLRLLRNGYKVLKKLKTLGQVEFNG